MYMYTDRTSSRKMNRLMNQDDSKHDSEDLDVTSSSASSDQDMNYSSSTVQRPVFHHMEMADRAEMLTSQRFRLAPPTFAPLPLLVHRPVVPVEFSAG